MHAPSNSSLINKLLQRLLKAPIENMNRITEIINKEVVDKEKWKKEVEEALQRADLATQQANLATHQSLVANEQAARVKTVLDNRIPNDDEYGDDQDGNDEVGNGNNEDGNGNNEPPSSSDDE
ncbi:hypothetical protein Tco_1232497 [Tanacetum coccineum]